MILSGDVGIEPETFCLSGMDSTAQLGKHKLAEPVLFVYVLLIKTTTFLCIALGGKLRWSDIAFNPPHTQFLLLPMVVNSVCHSVLFLCISGIGMFQHFCYFIFIFLFL